MKRLLAASITVAVLATVLWISRRSAPIRVDSPANLPETCIERMFSAAEQGDVATYLDCFTGAERLRLDRELADQSRKAYATSLREALRDLKGRAVFAAGTNDQRTNEVGLTVERVYVNRAERQTYRLVRLPDRWRIANVQAVQAFQPATPYGTPVYESSEPANKEVPP